jgi:glycosyltransferase involved in cell wall biosynthesis
MKKNIVVSKNSILELYYSKKKNNFFNILKNLYYCFKILHSCQYEKRYYTSQYPDFVEYVSRKPLWKYRNSSFLPIRVICMFLYHPVVHYVFRGVYEGKDLVDNFDSAYYLSKYPGVSDKTNPYYDYLTCGKLEGRAATRTCLSHNEFYENITSLSASNIKTDLWASILKIISGSQSYVLVFSHGVGGGAEEYLKTLIHDLQSEFQYIGIFYPSQSKKNRYLELRVLHNTVRTKIYLREFHDIIRFVPQKVIINNLAFYKPSILNQIFDFLISYSGDIKILFHDFYALCPSVVLMESDVFCELKNCKNCSVVKSNDLDTWRKNWQQIFNKAKVTFFSESSKEIAEKVFEFEVVRVEVIPHQPLIKFADSDKYQYQASRELVVGFVGSVNKIKGADIIVAMARNNPDVDFVIVGAVVNEYKKQIDTIPNIQQTGAYSKDNLPKLLAEYNINIAAITTVVPETFCYVLQELMMLEYPVASFNIGAQGERTSTYKYGVVVDDLNADSMFAGIKQLEHKLGELYET